MGNNEIKKGLLLGGVFSAEVPDKSGEVISIKGMDISSLNDGTSILNSEHGNGFSDYLGRIISAKKIFKEEDCSSDHERKCFESVGKHPLIYGVAELFNDEDHSEAKHAAALIKHYKKRDLKISARFSIEGSSIEKDGSHIKRSIARRAALTISPANAACESDVLSELSKSEKDTYTKITKTYSSDSGAITQDLLVIDQESLVKSLGALQSNLLKLSKALEAGLPIGGPGTLQQGAAIQGGGNSGKHLKKKPEESSESSVSEGSQVLKPLDEEKADKLDDKVKDMDLKLKKAEVFVLRNLNTLAKPTK